MAEYFDMAIGSAHDNQVNGRRPDVSPSTICNVQRQTAKKWDTQPKCNLKFYGFEWRDSTARNASIVRIMESALTCKVAGLSLPDTVYRGHADCD